MLYLLAKDHRATAAAISSASSSSISSSRSHEGCRASFFASRSTVVALACEEGIKKMRYSSNGDGGREAGAR